MSTYSSKQIEIQAPAGVVYEKLSNFENLRELLDKAPLENIPPDKREMFEKIEITSDSISFPSPMGAMTLTVCERKAPELIKLKADNTPVPVALALHVRSTGEDRCEAKVDFDIDLPVFLKPMVGGQIQKAADQFGEVLKKLKF